MKLLFISILSIFYSCEIKSIKNNDFEIFDLILEKSMKDNELEGRYIYEYISTDYLKMEEQIYWSFIKKNVISKDYDFILNQYNVLKSDKLKIEDKLLLKYNLKRKTYSEIFINKGENNINAFLFSRPLYNENCSVAVVKFQQKLNLHTFEVTFILEKENNKWKMKEKMTTIIN
ncbi:MAG: hypothetical protein ACOVQ2_05045 [Flavobacterium sp.]